MEHNIITNVRALRESSTLLKLEIQELKNVMFQNYPQQKNQARASTALKHPTIAL